MAYPWVPPPEPTVPTYPPVGFTKTVTGTAATILTTAIPCFGVQIQSSSKDDSNGSMTGIVYVQIDNGAGTQVKAFELVQGEDIFIPCTTTSEIKVVTQTGTGWVRGLVFRARSAGING